MGLSAGVVQLVRVLRDRAVFLQETQEHMSQQAETSPQCMLSPPEVAEQSPCFQSSDSRYSHNYLCEVL